MMEYTLFGMQVIHRHWHFEQPYPTRIDPRCAFGFVDRKKNQVRKVDYKTKKTVHDVKVDGEDRVFVSVARDRTILCNHLDRLAIGTRASNSFLAGEKKRGHESTVCKTKKYKINSKFLTRWWNRAYKSCPCRCNTQLYRQHWSIGSTDPPGKCPSRGFALVSFVGDIDWEKKKKAKNNDKKPPAYWTA